METKKITWDTQVKRRPEVQRDKTPEQLEAAAIVLRGLGAGDIELIPFLDPDGKTARRLSKEHTGTLAGARALLAKRKLDAPPTSAGELDERHETPHDFWSFWDITPEQAEKVLQRRAVRGDSVVRAANNSSVHQAAARVVIYGMRKRSGAATLLRMRSLGMYTKVVENERLLNNLPPGRDQLKDPLELALVWWSEGFFTDIQELATAVRLHPKVVELLVRNITAWNYAKTSAALERYGFDFKRYERWKVRGTSQHSWNVKLRKHFERPVR